MKPSMISPAAGAAILFILGGIAAAEDETPAPAAQSAVQQDAAAGEAVTGGETALSVDTIVIQDEKKAVADLTRVDILNLSYDDLITMPFDILIVLADKLEISVEELLSMKMTVASRSGTTLREQPGILSVITGEEIRRTGARDLVDVLRCVPGFYFGLDVNGVTGVGMRGNWAHEGKVLLMVDGQEMNDLTYYIYPYGNHFPVDQIKRIEIIRGPGSSLYGGAAELGVINIITLQGGDLNGLNATLTVGRYQEMLGNIIEKLSDDEKVHTYDAGRANVSISMGEKVKDVEFAIHTMLGLASRSDKKMTSFYFYDYDWTMGRPEMDMAESRYGELPSANVNLGLKWRDLSVRMIYDYYKTWGIDTWIYDNVYHSWLAEVRYDMKFFNEKLTVTPKYNLRKMLSWWGVLDVGNIDYMRNTAGISFLSDPVEWLNLAGGIEGYYDYYQYIVQVTGYTDPWGDPLENVFWNGRPDIDFQNFAIFLQGLGRAPWGMNVTLGGRFEDHSQYGSAFAPRFAVTQVLNDLHFKLLISKAFRTPTIGALALPFDTTTLDDPQLKPEETWVQELEAGYRINKNMFVTANVYNIIMDKPICYFDLGDVWGYENIPAKTGSWGAELEYALRHNRANVTCNYSFYTNVSKEQVLMETVTGDTLLAFNVPGIEGPYIAAPQHKVGLTAAVNVWRDLWIAPSATFFSTTYGYLDVAMDTTLDDITGEIVDISGTQVLDSIAPTLLLNCVVTYENLFTRGLNVSAGVYDILGTEYPWVQAYNGFGAPIPGPSREFVLKVGYNLPVRR